MKTNLLVGFFQRHVGRTLSNISCYVKSPFPQLECIADPTRIDKESSRVLTHFDMFSLTARYGVGEMTTIHQSRNSTELSRLLVNVITSINQSWIIHIHTNIINPKVGLSVCLSVCLPVCLSVGLSFCLLWFHDQSVERI